MEYKGCKKKKKKGGFNTEALRNFHFDLCM